MSNKNKIIMEEILKDGRKVWIYWPDQCRLCKGYFFRSENKPCNKERTMKFIQDIRNLEHEAKGVWGSVEYKCDYFCLDDDKYLNDEQYGQQDCGCCAG